MTPKEMRKKAVEMFAVQKFHCSQVIAAVGQEKLGKGNDDVIRAMGGFGGGLCGNGEVCGALAGAMAVLGLRYSRAKSDEKEDTKMWKVADEVFRRFRDEIVNRNGSICCRDIACVNWKDRQQAKEFYQGSDAIKRCYHIVGETALMLGEILEREQG
ncbi:MAG: C-GCAxxG-C-C family protein [Smithella sp.]|nr:C_GCAxxG_C_C family protein [Syntrophaceae bacterium]